MSAELGYRYEYIGPGQGGQEKSCFRRIYDDPNRPSQITDSYGNPLPEEKKTTRNSSVPIQRVSEEAYRQYAETQQQEVASETRTRVAGELPFQYDEGGWRVSASMSPERRKQFEKTHPYPKESYTAKKRFESQGMKNYQDIMRQTCDIFSIPFDVFAQLLSKENRSMDPNARNSRSSAYGIGQMLSKTWSDMEKQLFDRKITTHRYLDRTNPTNQILLAGAYLEYVREKTSCSWPEAMIYYHTGPNIARLNLSQAMLANPAIAKRMPKHERPTKQEYFRAAAEYYNIARFRASSDDISA